MADWMKTAVTIVATLAVLETLRAISPALSWGVAIFSLGFFLGQIYRAGEAADAPVSALPSKDTP